MADVAFATSGSSGAAKEIVRREADLQADAAALVAAFPEIWAERPTVVASVPADHLYGALWRVRAPACAGCRVEPETAISVEQLAAARARLGRFLFVTTPSFLEKLLDHPDAAQLRGAFVGIVTSGSLLRGETALAAAERLGACPLEIFGSTEAGTVAFRRRADGDLWTLAPGVAASADADGQLVVDSPFAMARPLAMSDAVAFADPRRFRLLGRTDRRAKILETLVSLPDVEAAFEAHPLVAACRAETTGEKVPRLGALVVLSGPGRAALASGTHQALLARLRRDIMPKLGPAAFPRRMRAVRALPADARGKTTADAVRRALAASCREPVVTAWTQTAEQLAASLVFPPDSECFDGHFPGLPILPGVAQLYFLRHFAQQAFPDFPDAAVYRRLKFQRIALPGREIAMSVTRLGDGRFSFEMCVESGRCSSGIVEWTPTP
ncbi:MAG: AMP-binding protein [Kiritimatiellae bacterium]|nr:AMP-binding protein [Kiritimatiellia bacterium]